MVEPHAQTFTDEAAVEALGELRELDRAGRPLAQGSRALLPCACRPPWAGVAPHRPEAVPGSPWRVRWVCEGCGAAKG